MSIQNKFPINLKDTASELAELLSLDEIDHDKISILLNTLGYRDSPKEFDDTENLDLKQSDHIGIYEPKIIDGETHYLRDINLKEFWSFYADVPMIMPKKNKKRIVLLGESVARGFLLDPEYTPAFVLETLLKSRSDLFEAEVIDLAETNLGMNGLKNRFSECISLNPDIIVILAGNNWRTDLINFINSNHSYYNHISTIINRDEGISLIKDVVEKIFGEMVSAFLLEIGQLSKLNNIPVIFAIPEFNLSDCSSTPGERFVTRLSNEKIRKWIEAKKAAENSFKAKLYLDTDISAQIMIDLDSSHPLGYELMAKSKLCQELYDEARLLLEDARDTALYCRTNSKPRIFSIIRNTILKEADLHNIRVVDLPNVFKEHLNGKIPGRDLFLDYCHFTVEGIQVASEAIANKVLEVLVGKSTFPLINGRSVKASTDTMAMGHLFAAIHNGHWGQSKEIQYHHCLLAVKLSISTHKIMIYYIDMISRNTSNTLCKSFQELLAFPKMDKYVHALIHPKDLKSMELELVEAMIKALKYVGISADSYANNIRQEEHAVTNRKINLLKAYYHSTSYDEFEGTKSAFFKARDTESKFMVVGEKNIGILLSLTLRIPHLNEANYETEIKWNNVIISKLETGVTWQNYTLKIPAELVNDGINQIEIYWPMPAYESEQLLNGLSSIRLKGISLLDTAYYVFGEIYFFSAMAIEKYRDIEMDNLS